MGDGVVVFCPPSAVPPSSVTETRVIFALPLALVAGVKVKTPLALKAGCTEKSAALSLVTTMLRA